MPVDRRKRTVRHAQLKSTEKVASLLATNSCANETMAVAAEVHPFPQSEVIPVMKKKDKLQLKNEDLLQRGISATGIPYSKSHMRRLRRREKEQLSTDLSAVSEAIAAITEPKECDKAVEGDSTSNTQAHPGQIGKGKHISLTSNQRKRTFQAEHLRHKLIMQDNNFTANPFQTIRTHAQNTLVKHQA